VILFVIIAFVACLAVVGSSDADDTSSASYDPKCAVAYKAVRFWRDKTAGHRNTLGVSGLPPVEQKASCKRLRERMVYWRQTAAVTGRIVIEHHAYHYAWREWMPDKWQRVGACETGYGKRPGRFDWNSGTYQGFAGFHYGSWDSFVRRASVKAGPYPSEAYLATPRQQYEVALAIWRAYGFSGWGCRGA
jgi:hypothetical protein